MNYNKPPAKSECARREHLPNPTKSSDLPRRGSAAARRFVFPVRRSVLGEPDFLADRDFGADADDDGRLSAVDRACGAAAGCCEEVARPGFVIVGRSRSKNGVASLAYDPAIHAAPPLVQPCRFCSLNFGMDHRVKPGGDEERVWPSYIGVEALVRMRRENERAPSSSPATAGEVASETSRRGQVAENS